MDATETTDDPRGRQSTCALIQRPFFRILAAGITLCTVLGTASCFGASSEPDQPTAPDTPKEQTTPINVVASVNQWGALAEQIGGVHVKVTSILSSTTEDAHTFEPKTTAVDTLQKAQGRRVQRSGIRLLGHKKPGKRHRFRFGRANGRSR